MFPGSIEKVVLDRFFLDWSNPNTETLMILTKYT